MGDGSYTCIVEWQRTAYTISWLGSSQYPDLTTFPTVGNVDIRLLPQSSTLVTLWTNSVLVDYGAHAVIRSTLDSSFPIIKLAHPNKQSIALLQHEFSVLVALPKLGAAVVEADSTPILDNGVICGYRMKRLEKLDTSELLARRPEIEAAAESLHSKGYCHGDLSPSNIMKDEKGRIQFIDLSFAGRLNDRIPQELPTWVHDGVHFKLDTDHKAMARLYSDIRSN